ncbi:PAS domain S-box-containing protein [Nocardioides salarius]|uniref:histidine kinase n=1 Tax=Nocardioides salarius TaxID=374513 RepID=A0ABS2M7H0_9ACTN|nr:PAS domain-containing sensor histidine kinase [Nocardioides salarius]MBM7507123.1 PAS domain S-box-containing protein [Nocardioides salarius]
MTQRDGGAVAVLGRSVVPTSSTSTTGRAGRWQLRVAFLLGLVALLGLAAVRAAPDDSHVIGIWPVGAATGVLVLAPRRHAPVLLGAVLLVALLTLSLAQRPAEVVVGYTATIVLETWVVSRLLLAGGEGPWRLVSDADLRRYLGAGLLGGLFGLAGGALTSAATGFGEPGFVGLALGASHLASQLVFTPLWARLPGHGPIAHRPERVLQWGLVLLLAPAVLAPTLFPPVAFLLIPLLAWSALRVSPREALAQLVVVLALAVVMTTAGRGPFADVLVLLDLPRDARAVLLAAYAATCALIVVPLLLRVGESVEAARAAAAERDTLGRIVQSATGMAIVGADREGRITLFNPGAERLLGWAAEEVTGLPTRVLHSTGQVSAKARELGVADDFASVSARMLEPDMAGADMGFVRKDGTERMHSMTLGRITDEAGRVLGYVSTSEDVTDRVAAEDALREALARMQEVDAVKDAFVSSVSHELRTPITSIQGYLELLGDGSFGDLSEQQRSAVAKVAANSERLLTLIDDLLTLSRVQESGLGLERKVLDLGDVVRAGCGVVSPGGERAGVPIAVEVPGVPVPFLGDRDMLERVVINLVGNAVKFTPRGGRVEVVLRRNEQGSTITVVDTGIGIPRAEQERLFTRFFRSSLAQAQAIPGSGLGLSIAHSVVTQHGGTLRAESEPGAGTTFVLELPAMA